MHRLSIHTATDKHLIEVPDRQSVREALDLSDLRVRAACGGTGSCGACSVRLLTGQVSVPTVAEHMKLSSAERAAGRRLACQLRLLGDAEIQLDQPAPPSQWKSISAEHLKPVSAGLPGLGQHIYGVAVDLGTTHIRLALWNRQLGRRLATRCGPNPQIAFGADFLTRLDAVRKHGGRAEELSGLVRAAIVQAIRDILARDMGEVTPMLAEIGQIFIVGNTAMLALLTGQGGEALADPANWQSKINYQPADPQGWQSLWYMPNATITLPDPVAGFVGSDLIADMLATRLVEQVAPALLLDVGTNTEIVLWDGCSLHATSVPGGPAFEGVGIRHGMPAESGAICSVRPAGVGFECKTIGGAAALGFCGSGLVDAIALLLASGKLKASGRFATSPGEEGYRLDLTNPRSAITGTDVDLFQRAKAATAAAMALLLSEAGLAWRDLRRLCVCGAFGHTLDIGHAQAVGLLPPISPAAIELQSDASLAGCEAGLLSQDGHALFSSLAVRIRVINLALAPTYEDCYLDHLRLSPIAPDTD